MSAEARLKELGIVLPSVPKPVANYLPYRLAGNILYLAGQGPRDESGKQLTGKVGAEISIEEGYRRARLSGWACSPAMRDAFGSLDRVDYIVKLLGMVNATPEFNDSPKVINGCSDLFVEVFGEAGRHARSAVGNVMLPNQISVEIEGIVAVKALIRAESDLHGVIPKLEVNKNVLTNTKSISLLESNTHNEYAEASI